MAVVLQEVPQSTAVVVVPGYFSSMFAEPFCFTSTIKKRVATAYGPTSFSRLVLFGNYENGARMFYNNKTALLTSTPMVPRHSIFMCEFVITFVLCLV